MLNEYYIVSTPHEMVNNLQSFQLTSVLLIFTFFRHRTVQKNDKHDTFISERHGYTLTCLFYFLVPPERNTLVLVFWPYEDKQSSMAASISQAAPLKTPGGRTCSRRGIGANPGDRNAPVRLQRIQLTIEKRSSCEQSCEQFAAYRSSNFSTC